MRLYSWQLVNLCMNFKLAWFQAFQTWKVTSPAKQNDHMKFFRETERVWQRSLWIVVQTTKWAHLSLTFTNRKLTGLLNLWFCQTIQFTLWAISSRNKVNFILLNLCKWLKVVQFTSTFCKGGNKVPSHIHAWYCIYIIYTYIHAVSYYWSLWSD